MLCGVIGRRTTSLWCGGAVVMWNSEKASLAVALSPCCLVASGVMFSFEKVSFTFHGGNLALFTLVLTSGKGSGYRECDGTSVCKVSRNRQTSWSS